MAQLVRNSLAAKGAAPRRKQVLAWAGRQARSVRGADSQSMGELPLLLTPGTLYFMPVFEARVFTWPQLNAFSSFLFGRYYY